MFIQSGLPWSVFPKCSGSYLRQLKRRLLRLTRGVDGCDRALSVPLAKPRNDTNHRDLTKNFLNAADWVELECFYESLKPFYVLTKTTEDNANKPGAEGGHGAMWETLKTMDYLFIKFKQATYEARLEDASHFKSGIC